jgi:NADH dehydrogenase
VADVTLVNERNYMLYTPFMGAVAGGSLDPRHIAFPLREELTRTEVRVARIVGGDPAAQVLRLRGLEGHETELRYDRLVVSLGSVTRTPPVPGVQEHALGFKTLDEAVVLRDRLLRTFETAEALRDPAERAAYLTVRGRRRGLRRAWRPWPSRSRSPPTCCRSTHAAVPTDAVGARRRA